MPASYIPVSWCCIMVPLSIAPNIGVARAVAAGTTTADIVSGVNSISSRLMVWSYSSGWVWRAIVTSSTGRSLHHVLVLTPLPLCTVICGLIAVVMLLHWDSRIGVADHAAVAGLAASSAVAYPSCSHCSAVPAYQQLLLWPA